MTAAQVASLSSFRSERRLSALLHGYEDLDTPFAAADHAIVRMGSIDDVGAWRRAMVALLEANLGAATMRTMFTLSERWSSRPVADLVTIAEAKGLKGDVLPVLSSCPTCGSKHLTRRGTAVTQLGIKQRLQCNDCGAWSSGPLTKSKNRITGN